MMGRLILAAVVTIGLVIFIPIVIVYVTALLALLAIFFVTAFIVGVPIKVTKNGQSIGYYKYGKFYSTLKGTSRRFKNPSCVPDENEEL